MISEFEAYLILILLFGAVVYVVFMAHLARKGETQKPERKQEKAPVMPEAKDWNEDDGEDKEKMKMENFEHV